MNRTLLTIAGTLGFSAVLLGAFGAHGLRDRWRRRCSRSTGRACSTTWCTRVAVLRWRSPPTACARPRLVAGLFTAGIAIFSGTLYLLAITGVTKLGAVTPIGGLLLMAGWVGA